MVEFYYLFYFGELLVILSQGQRQAKNLWKVIFDRFLILLVIYTS